MGANSRLGAKSNKYGIPAIHLSKLQRVQNAARLTTLTYTLRYDYITPILCSMHWLPVKFRIQYKIAMITFKAIRNLAPAYLSDLVTIKRGFHYNLRSSKSMTLFDLSAKYKRTLGERSFKAAAPKTWNSLPDNIRNQS